MSERYTWAVDGRTGRTGRSRERQSWLLSRSDLPPGVELPPAQPGPPDALQAGLRPLLDDGLWQPIGPTTTLRGFIDSDVRVAGRVRDITLSPDGLRAYAASALGGLWYSGDAGVTWEPVGQWRFSNAKTVAASSNSLTSGAVHGLWGANEAVDEVWLATGEPMPTGINDTGTGGEYGGVGVLHAVGPVATVRRDPLADPWGTAQAQALSGAAVFRMVANPDQAAPRDLLAATTVGLHRHNPAALPGTDPWSLITVPAWEAVSPGASTTAVVTDLAWTPATAAHGARIWLTVVHSVPTLAGLWLSTDNGATFSQLALPGTPVTVPRFAIGWHLNHPDLLYVLCTGPTLWRVDGTQGPPVTGGVTVSRLPTKLFSPDNGSDGSNYAIAVAVDPGNNAQLMIGGASVDAPIDQNAPGGGSNAAALYQLTVSAAGAGFATNYKMPADAGPRDATWVGSEVHADVHRIIWETPGASSHVWIGSDGGVSRSTRGGVLGSYLAVSSGMAVSEPGFVANHPTSPGPVLAGMQDNGTQLRIGEGVWRLAERNGDSGGVAFDPGAPGRFVAQTIHSNWYDDNDDVTPTFRKRNDSKSAYASEDNNAAFYSNAAVVRTTDANPVTRLAVGTDRVWLTEKWGASTWDGTAYRRTWVTLPTHTDPRAGDAGSGAALTQDQLPPGAPPWNVGFTSGIHVLRWQSPTVLLAVTEGTVHSLTDPGKPGAWALAQIATRAVLPTAGAPAAPPAPVAAPTLPGLGRYNDLAVDPTLPGAFYLATSHPLEPLWWWDGTQCHPTTLGTALSGTTSPAYSVVIDPVTPTVVYVGTTIGVWRGELTPPAGGNPPTWNWQKYANGLPEAAVQDLSITAYAQPGGGNAVWLLRAALQSRGLWEVDLRAPAVRQTYLRVHPFDTRRLTPTPVADPLAVTAKPRRTWQLDWAYERNRDHRTGAGKPAAHPDGTAVGNYLWHASPDVWCRPAPVSVAPGTVPVPPGLPWSTQPADRFWLWSLQTALRALPAGQFPDAPLIVPDGRWTPWFGQRLRKLRAGFAPPLADSRGIVDAELWKRGPVQAGFWTPPWSTLEPAEADLVERVLGMATPRAGSVNGMAMLAASTGVLQRRHQVDVCVHHRGRLPAEPGDVAVVLLRTLLPAAPAQWNAVVAPDLTGLAAALDHLPGDTSSGPAPNALPGYVPPAGWAFVDAARPARRPRLAVSAGQACVVTFDADFSTDPVGADVLLLALGHRRDEPVALPAGAVSAGVLASSHAAARSVRVRS
jgi:hypothetical protein